MAPPSSIEPAYVQSVVFLLLPLTCQAMARMPSFRSRHTAHTVWPHLVAAAGRSRFWWRRGGATPDEFKDSAPIVCRMCVQLLPFPYLL